MKFLKLWYIRNFKKLTNQESLELGLKFLENVYGDAINHLDCRSLWVDSKCRFYKGSELFNV